MKTKSHLSLGEYLMQYSALPLPWKYRKIFLLGCIEPDFNPVTYLRGWKTVEHFRGHNFRNIESCLKQLSIDLGNCIEWGLKEFYHLGKLMHYLTDSFTYPHNENYGEGIRAHRRYEKRLRPFFETYLDNWDQSQNGSHFPMESIWDTIESGHRRYMEAPSGMENDAFFTITMTSMVFHLLSGNMGPTAPSFPR